MDKQSNNNINEIKLLVLQLAQQFNKKFDEQARVIVDQRDRLNSQQDQIHNQRAIIDELAWQIRDLRDSVRKCSEQISNAVHSRYYDDIDTFSIINNGGPVAENGRLKLIIPETNAARQSNHRAGRQKFCSLFFYPAHTHTHFTFILPRPPHIHIYILLFAWMVAFVHCVCVFFIAIHRPCMNILSLFQSIFDFHFPYE